MPNESTVSEAWQDHFLALKAKLLILKFLDARIQDISTSISMVHDLIEISPDDDEDGDESEKHI